jgi:DNA-binding LacI/PurR family transcriptional regulator
VPAPKSEAGLLAQLLPTAMITANGLSAIDVLDRLLRAGVRLPQDLSVVGYDDSLST